MNESDPTAQLGMDSTHVARSRRPVLPSLREHASDGSGGGLMELLQRRPELVTNRSFIVETAVDEYLKLSKHRPTLSARDYCRRFTPLGASIESSIYRQLEVEAFVRRHSWLTDTLTSETWPTPGDRWGSFNLLEEVGRGALARVYLCTQPELGHRQVIVKISKSSFVEADALGRLRHPNIVPVHSVERVPTSGMTMLCMPFLGRSTLHDFLDLLHENGERQPGDLLAEAARLWEQPSDRIDERACPLPAGSQRTLSDCVAYIGACLAGALAHAHAHGIVHGDIKSSNVLLSSGGAPLLMDFNLSGNTARSVVAKGGTLPYMPPEQLRAVALENPEAAEYEQRSDLFSLGVVLYEAIAGRLPFPLPDARTERDTVKLAEHLLARQREDCVPLREVNHQVPASLSLIIQRCLAFRPDDRINSSAELHSLLEGEVRRARRLSRRLLARPKTLAAAVGAVFLVSTAWFVHEVRQPAEHVRLLDRALVFRQGGDFARAETSLRRAMQLQPSYGDAQFEMGRTALQQKEWTVAREWFSKLADAEQRPRGAAYAGYCSNLEGNSGLATAWYEKAIDWGCNAPEVFNNLAVSLEAADNRYGKDERLLLAEQYLGKARQELPEDDSIRFNWIYLQILKSHNHGAEITDEILRMCRELAAAYPECEDVQERTATAFALACATRPELCDEGVEYLAKAAALGHFPGLRHLKESSAWAAFHGSPRFEQLVDGPANISRTRRGGERIPRLMEPQSLALLNVPGN